MIDSIGANLKWVFRQALAGFVICLSTGHSAALAETVAQLQANYSGTTHWNTASGTLTFTSSGIIDFSDKSSTYKNHYWDVPSEVSKILINANVTVTGAFHTYHTCTIEGVDRETSIVFGTDEQAWADEANGVDLPEWEYCQFQNRGGVLTVKNLTALNPFSYFIRGWGPVCHAKSCNFIDNRGGWHNHSDGFSGGHGSTVDDCYFEAGDDVIKCYFNITVTNTTIKMIQNSVPFQFGWGTYQNSHSQMSNVTIIGNSGRGGNGNPVFQWKSGSDDKTFVLDGCNIQNPNATLFSIGGGSGSLNLTITDAYIKVKNYGTPSFPGTRTICGTTDQLSFYDCVVPDIQVSFDNVVTATSLLPATLEATVIQNSEPITGVLFEVLEDDVEFPEGASVTLTDLTTDNLNPTAAFTASREGIYKFRLTVSDESGNTNESLAETRIYEDACQANKNVPGWSPGYYDINADCIIDLADYIELAKQWLMYDGMIYPETYASDVTYFPSGSGVEDFEQVQIRTAQQSDFMLYYQDALDFEFHTEGGWIFTTEGDGFTVRPTGGPDGLAYVTRASSGTANSRGFAYVIRDNFQTTGQVTVEFDYLFQKANGGGQMAYRVVGINSNPAGGPWLTNAGLDGGGGTGDYGPEHAVRYIVKGTSGAESVAAGGTYLVSRTSRQGHLPTGSGWQHESQTVDLGSGYEWLVISFAHNFQTDGQGVSNPYLYFGINNVAAPFIR